MACWPRIFVQLITVIAGAGAMLLAGGERQRISVQEARRLVYEVVKLHNPGAAVSRMQNSYDREFLYFEVLTTNPVASPVVGHYAVNPWTGDVWNPALCERLTLPSLKRMQERIRKRFKFAEQEYARLRAKKPLCS